MTSVINFQLIKNFLTKLIDSKNKIEMSNILLSAILESSPDVIVFSLDTNYCYTAFNNIHKKVILNIWKKEIKKGMNMLDVIGYDEDRKKARENFDRALNGESFSIVEEYGDNKYSRLYWQDYYSPIISSDGKVIGLTCFVLNITALKKAEERNIFLSYHDELTGLYNRRFYEEQLKQMDTESNYPISVIMADVNGLKFTNDVFGHTEGDKLIKAFAEVLKQNCRKQDVVARIGGDEFYILLPKTSSIQLEKIISKIQKSISIQHLDKGILSVSFGFATKYNANELLEEVYNKADDYMYSQKLLGRDVFEINLIKHLNSILYDKNLVEQLHGKEVSSLSKRLGIALDLSQDEVDQLELAGLLHDIGKVDIDYKILSKPNNLNEYEWKEVKRHCEIGYKILNYLNKYKNIAECVLYHHERIDGKGYPKGLKGTKIPLFSRIIHIVDAYQSMTSNNTYGNTLNIEDAINELKINAGTQFDAYIAQVFVEKVLELNWN
ncbi:diguanylate cyclase [Clostridium sp.]|uniref:diguanylate cyclase n=1 Tax=Clostridium sp. TaxID=1506 RepID=UPI0025BFA98E|nr:diguanylate cyclase [Clostridium sp.]